MEFPTLVYRDKGPHQRPGGSYNYTSALNEDHFQELVAQGWSASLQEAIDFSLPGAVGKNQSAGINPAEMKLSDIPIDLALELVQDWLGHRMRELEIEVPEPEEGILPEMKMLEEIRIDAAAIALESVKDQNAQHWLTEKANGLGLEVEEGLSADELLFLICDAYANKKDPDEVPDEQKPATRDELEAKAKELNIQFDGRTSDAGLAKRIEDALKEA